MKVPHCSAPLAAVLAHCIPFPPIFCKPPHNKFCSKRLPIFPYPEGSLKSQTERTCHLKPQLWLVRTLTLEEILICWFSVVAISSRFPIPLAVMKNNCFVSSQSLGNACCLMLSYSDLQTINAYSRNTFFRVLHTDCFSCNTRASVLLCVRAQAAPHHCQMETSSFHLRFLWKSVRGNTLLPGSEFLAKNYQLVAFVS